MLKNKIVVFIILIMIISAFKAAAQTDDVYGKPDTASMVALTSNVDYNNGIQDAKLLFRPSLTSKYIGFMGGFAWGPILGIIPPLIMENEIPYNMTLQYPQNIDKFKNIYYYNGYAEQAMKMRNRKVWGAYGAGAVSSLALIVTLIAISQQ